MGIINWVIPCMGYWHSNISDSKTNNIMIEKPIEKIVLKSLEEKTTLYCIISLSDYDLNENKSVEFNYGHISEEDYMNQGFSLPINQKDRVLLSLPNTTFSKTGIHFVEARLGNSVAKSYFKVEISED
ncbi:hypothetical protein [Staphylococcus hominis]